MDLGSIVDGFISFAEVAATILEFFNTVLGFISPAFAWLFGLFGG